MDVPPERLGELSDYKQTRGKNALIYTYQPDGKYPEGLWLACTYGEPDQVTYSKRLDDSVRVYAFTYRKGEHVGQNDIAIQCK